MSSRYVQDQCEALCNDQAFGRVLCKDIQNLLYTWLWNDPDLQYILQCKTGGVCRDHNEYRCDCALRHVARQTECLAIAAIERSIQALPLVSQQTPRVCSFAITVEPTLWTIKHIKLPITEEMWVAVLRNCGGWLEYVDDPTYAMCLAAVQSSGYYALSRIKDQTHELCLAAVKQSGEAVRLVNQQTEDICLAAVQQTPLALQHCKILNEEICLAAVSRYGGSLRDIPLEHQTRAVIDAALQKDPKAKRYVKTRTYNLRSRNVH